MNRSLEPYQFEIYIEDGRQYFNTVNTIKRGNVDISKMGVTTLPHFKYVGGWLDCSHNRLTSLEGCPIYVGNGFSCSGNKLTSLKYRPRYVGGDFYCYNNYLI